MRRVLRLILPLLALLLLLPLGLGALGYHFAREALPLREGTIVVAGLGAPVEVLRDERGVPHLYAETMEDLFFAQGFVSAQDRLWQMEINRRTAWGRLAEVFGEAGLEADRLFRTFGLGRVAWEEEALLSSEERALLQAYADGVNAYVAGRNGALPWEFRLLLVDFEPWRPVDSLAWAKVLAWQLGTNWSSELLRAALLEDLSPQQVAGLMPSVPAGIVPHVAKDLPRDGLGRSLLLRLRQVADLVRPPSSDLGSNNWVISGARTTTGRPLLANDPHLGLQMPSIWYEVHLVGGDVDATGFSMPGMPGLIVGHNQHIAWGVTNTGADGQDLFVERRNPENPHQFLYEGAWVDARLVLRETIHVRGRLRPVEVEIPYTRHGPVLNADVEDEHPLSLRWTALQPSRMTQSIMRLLVAEDWAQFRDALRDFSAPVQNFVYADVDGNIGLQVAGLVPVRGRGDGLLPVPGWTADYEWGGFVPFVELPSEFNPTSGLIATANNRIVAHGYPHAITHEWAAYFRVERIVSLLGEKDRIGMEDSRAVQLDVRSALAAALVPYILEAADSAGRLNRRSEATPSALAALAELHGWDYEMTEDTVAGTVLQVFYNQLLRHTFEDDLGEDRFELYQGDSRAHVLATLTMLAEGNAPLFDDRRTPEIEGRDEIVWRSFTSAVDALTDHFGDDLESWRWRNLHTVEFSSPLGSIPLVGGALNRGPFPRPGDGSTVNVSAYSFLAPYREAHHASFRLLVDVGNWDETLSVLTTGQSGQVLSPHYDDQITPWLEGRYHRAPFGEQQVRAAARLRLMLTPYTVAR